MSEQWKTGDEVILKSGGPIMTVAQVGVYGGQPGCRCTWFVDNKPQEHVFPADVLKRPSTAKGF
jgi:uncharacterized protein YodC (DUF2158 family)